jgi:protein SPA2
LGRAQGIFSLLLEVGHCLTVIFQLYLQAQTESIVYAIQSVLSGVRAPTPSPTLNENLTQIITIVSSIVAVCNDNLPPASA